MNVTIVGLDVVGTSLGLALKAASAEISIIGHDPDTQHVSRAKKLGAIDKSHWNLISACEKSDLILLALGLDAVEPALRALQDALKERAIIIDLVPLKGPVMAWAGDILPETVQFVGGHVVCSRLVPGQMEPSAELLRGATFYIVASEKTAPWALEAASNLALAVGAKPLFIDAVEHDGLMAATSGLPLLGALALMEAVTGGAGLRERAQSMGGEFAAFANALIHMPEAPADLVAANRDNLLHWLDAYAAKLTELRELASAQDVQALKDRFVAAQQACAEWLTTGGVPRSELPVEDMGGGFRAMFLGGLGRKRTR